MARDSAIPPESFEKILAWLNPDREVAATMRVALRHDLEKIFIWNHCPDPEGSTDEVFDRVAKKIHLLRHTYDGDPKLFFYGVARNLIKEIHNKNRTHVSLEDAELVAKTQNDGEQEKAEMREDCLHACLEKLSKENGELIREYYAKDKQAKIDHRAEMAKRLGMSVENLRVKVHRIRLKLGKCIERCLNRKTQNK